MLSKSGATSQMHHFYFPIHKDTYRQEKAPQQSEIIIQIVCDAFICNPVFDSS